MIFPHIDTRGDAPSAKAGPAANIRARISRPVRAACLLLFALVFASSVSASAVRVMLQGTFNGAPAGAGSCQIALAEGYVSPGSGGNIDGIVFLEPSVNYQLLVDAEQMQSLVLNILPPAGYHVWLDNLPQSQIQRFNGDPSEPFTEVYQLELRSTNTGGNPGTGGSVKLGDKLSWGVNLGRLYNGTLAGALVMRAELSGDSINRGSIGSREVERQVVMIHDAQLWLRQVIAPEVFVDLNDVLDSGNHVIGFTADFYPLPAMGTADASGIRAIKPGSNYYIRHTVKRTGPSLDELEVTSEAGSNVQTSHITRQGGTWMKTIANEQIVETVEPGPNGPNGERSEITTIKDAAGNVARKTKRIYKKFSWNDTLPDPEHGTLAEVIEDPDGAALTTRYAYYDDPESPGSFTQVKTIMYPDGNWVKYDYHEQGAGGYGRLRSETRAWLDTPPPEYDDDTMIELGHSIMYNYAADWNGVEQFLASRVESIAQNTVSGQTITHSFPTVSVMSGTSGQARLWKQVTQTWTREDSFPLVSEVTRFQTGHEDGLGVFDGLPYSSKQPDGSKTVYVHRRVTYEETGEIFTPDNNGAMMQEIAYQGMANPGEGLVLVSPASLDNIQGYDAESIYLIPGRSTKTITYKKNGRIVLKENYIYAGGSPGNPGAAFKFLGGEKHTHTDSGQLSRIDALYAPVLNDPPYSTPIYEATWAAGFKTREKGADGIEYTYAPDAAMRVARVTKSGAPAITSGSIAAQGHIATDYTYNAAGDIISRTTTDDNGLSLQETFAYDPTGRPVSQTAPGGDTTTIAYGTRTHTITYPGGATRTVEAFLDGQIKSETGTAIVGVHYSYGVDASQGFRSVETRAGSATSNAKTINTYDQAGRLVRAETPKMDGSGGTNTTTYTYDHLGRLVRTDTPGLAPTLYEYDSGSALLRQGLLLGIREIDEYEPEPPASLDAACGDRMIEFEHRIVDEDGTLWSELKSRYLAGDSSTLRSHTRTRLTGLAPSLASHVETLDAHGNKTVQTTSTNRASALATYTTIAPGSNIHAVSRTYNGLLVDSRDASGQFVSYDYDSLGRSIRTHRPGKTPVETVYDPVTGRVQRTQFADETHTLIAAYEYDAAGNISQTTDAAGAAIFATYNDRGQPTARFGTGAVPVAYEYDALGRLTKQTTWRGEVTETLPDDAGNKNVTSFEYVSDFALVKKATDALGHAISYSYDETGRITALARSRKLADAATPLTVSYAYDPMTGELTGKTYNDGTPALAYAYDATGRLSSVTDALGTRAFAYADDETGRLLAETLPAYYQDAATGLRRLAYAYDTGAPHPYGSAYAPLAGRLKTTALVNSAEAIEASAAYWFLGNGMTGKIEVADPTATGGGQRAFQYAWMAQQPALLHQASEMQTGLTRTISYADAYWDSPTRVAAGFASGGSAPLVAADATYDTMGRLSTLQQSGSALTAGYGEPIHRSYTYNLRGQLTAARSYMGAAGASESRPMPGCQYTFEYDNAGNRTATAANNDESLRQAETVNALGLVTQKENKSIHVSGVADTDVRVAARSDEGLSTVRPGAYAGRFWSIELSVDAATDSEAGRINANVYLGKPSPAPGDDNIIKTVPLAFFMPPKKEAFTYDADGNLTSDGQWTYAYDAENRLVAMQTKDALIPALLAHTGGPRPLLINFTYDYLNRRVGKRVQEKIDGQWQERYHHRYVYNGSALIAEIDAGTHKILRTFAWGATGELLMIHDRTASTPQTYLPVHDFTGSVTGIVRADSNTLIATYEYDPNGNLLRAQGEYAKKNPFAWKGGWMDWETGLANAGSVYYSARLGRYINTIGSGAGDAVTGSYGVAPVIAYLPVRQYPSSPAPRRMAAPTVCTCPENLDFAGITDPSTRVVVNCPCPQGEAYRLALDGYLSHNPEVNSPSEGEEPDDTYPGHADYWDMNLYINRNGGYWNYTQTINDSFDLHDSNFKYLMKRIETSGSITLVTMESGDQVVFNGDTLVFARTKDGSIYVFIGPNSVEFSGGPASNSSATTTSQSTAHRTKSPVDIFKRDEKNNLLFKVTGKAFDKDNPESKFLTGYLTTKDGIRVIAYMNLSTNIANDTNCHGYSIADGLLWINPVDMTSLLANSKLLTKVTGDPLACDIAVYWDKGVAVHSGRYVGDGNITAAAGSEIFSNGSRIDTAPKETLYRNIAPQYYRRVK